MNYKRVIKSQELRFKILRLLSFIPDITMIKIQYRIKTGRKLNLDNPKRFTEKLQWYKLNYRDPLMTKCADKYEVREYVASKGLSDILVPIYGVYNRGEDIDFEKLPGKFVLKTTNGSHTNILCKDKSQLDLVNTRKTLNRWLQRSKQTKAGREWAYYNIKPRIICEKYLEDNSNEFDGINDYKFICMNGKVQFVYVDVDRFKTQKRNFYDTNWNYINVKSDHPNIEDCVPKPEGLEKMLKIANILAQDFPQVRVDLYWVNGKVIFGELTFYLLSGYVNFAPDEFDYVLGEKFCLPAPLVQ
ncbi:ATP-grasp fold amidoligase family protein [Cytobacillus firmus]